MNISLSSHGVHRTPLRHVVCLAAAAFSLAVVPARAASEPSPLNGQKKSYAYSWQQELQQGADADKEITAQMGLYENPDVQAYVESVGQRVLGTSTFADPATPAMYRNTKFTFRVLDTPVVNAFALPGGYVYVTRGLLTHVDNEAQLAVVLGHEIAHVAARHSSQQARRSMWGQIGVIAGAVLGQTVLGEKMPDIGSTILNAGGPAMQTFLLKYSREAENEADTFGVTYAARSGYAAGESARFFQSLQRMAAQEGKTLPTWQSTHPDPGDRANHVRQLASAATPGAPAPSNVGENEYLRHIEGLVVGEDPREGFVQSGVFYHPTLHFQLPVASGWKVDNQHQAVIFGEPNGKALFGLRLASETRAREAASQFVAQNKVQVTASGDTTVNGLPASVIVGQANTDDGAVGVWNAFVEMDGKVYSLLGYAPAQAFEQFRSTYESIAAGFSPLRDSRMAQVQPARLKLVRADRTAPFASFVPTSLPPTITAESIAIMNQVSMDQSVPAGTTLKVPDAPALPSPAQNYSNQPGNRRYERNYPNSRPRTYPSNQPPYGQPAPQDNYPPANNYPSQNYPQGGYPSTPYPPQNYPPGQNYPSQGYPPQNPQGYPQQNYPPQGYPQQSYPPYPSNSYPPNNQGGYPNYGTPAFPQPGGTQPSQPAQNQGPVWPR